MRKFSTSVTLMFRELPALERFAAARSAGFDNVEIQVLEALPVDMLREARSARVNIHLLNVGMGDFIRGGPGLIGLPGLEDTFLSEVQKALAIAKALAIPFVHLGPGRVPQGIDRDICLGVMKKNIVAAIAAAAGMPVTLLLEPLNAADMPDVLLGNIDDTAAMIRMEFAGKLWLMFDIYHIARNGQDVIDAYRRNKDLIRHVQFSDAPGRHEPGTGEIDFPSVFAAIEAEGYDGYFGAEYMPSKPTRETFSWLTELSQ